MVAVGLSALGTAVTYLWPQAREFGFLLLGIGLLAFLVAIVGVIRSIWPHIVTAKKRLGMARMLLLFAILGTWLFLSATLGLVGWVIANPAAPSNAMAAVPAQDEGPIGWVYTITLDRAGPNGVNISALRFRGANISKRAIRLKDASITSLIDGTKLPLEIVAADKNGNQKLVSLDQIQLVPPGALIEVLAKLGPPDPDHPGFVLGVDADTLLAKWRQFAFEATDDTRSYRMDFNENVMMIFFQGKVGPRVAIKE